MPWIFPQTTGAGANTHKSKQVATISICSVNLLQARRSKTLPVNNKELLTFRWRIKRKRAPSHTLPSLKQTESNKQLPLGHKTNSQLLARWGITIHQLPPPTPATHLPFAIAHCHPIQSTLQSVKMQSSRWSCSCSCCCICSLNRRRHQRRRQWQQKVSIDNETEMRWCGVR